MRRYRNNNSNYREQNDISYLCSTSCLQINFHFRGSENAKTASFRGFAVSCRSASWPAFALHSHASRQNVYELSTHFGQADGAQERWAHRGVESLISREWAGPNPWMNVTVMTISSSHMLTETLSFFHHGCF